MLSRSGHPDLALSDVKHAPAPFANLPLHHFGAISADPAYHFETYSEKGQGRSPSQHYRDMTLDQIAAFPIAELLRDHAWLFLWIPDPHIESGLNLMRAWGFKFSGKAFTWVKYNPETDKFAFGLGHTTRKNTESCWLGRRGKPRRLSKGVHELIIAPRREHSRKPDEQYGRIERYCAGPYLELFARQRWRGWTAWGDETDRFAADDYDAADDLNKSVIEGFRAIRERKAAGGPGWPRAD
jgi:N6-adenosine-specific RNA methylase IME4